MKALFSPSQVEQELRMLQRELSPSEARAALFNLVIYGKENLPNPSDRALSYLLGKRAARIIQIQNVNAAESTMSVTARCFPDQENRGVCFQEIMIQNGRDNAGAAPGTWTPLLIRDIPVYVLWYDAISTQREYLSQMREQIDKLIFDSRWNESTGEAPDAICSVVAESFLREGVLVSDLAWKRGLALRRITASLFEGEAASEKLDRIESIEIVSESESEAHLYGLWLASRLGWSWRGRFAKNGRTTWRAADPGGREILIHSELCEGAGSGEVDVDLSVQIDLIGGEAIFVNGTPGGCADTIMPGKEGERHLFLSPSTGQMLQEEVDSLRSDYLYAEALALCSPGASGLAAHDSGDSE